MSADSRRTPAEASTGAPPENDPASDAAAVPASERSRRTASAVLVAVVVVVGLAAAAFRLTLDRGDARGEPGSSGPLAAGSNVTLSGIALEQGVTATWGAVVLRNTSAQPVTLRTATLGGGLPGSRGGIAVDTVTVVDPAQTHGTGIGMVRGDGADTIPLGLRSPLAGHLVPAGRDATLLVEFTATARGTWRFDHVDVEYTAAGRSYTVRMPQALGVCVDTGDSCDVGTPPGLG